MDFLELVQTAHREAKLPGASPASVAGQTGRTANMVEWVKQAWHDVQREKSGKWKWMRALARVDTTADQASYDQSEFTDVVTAAAIRFRSWDLRLNEPPLIYKVSDGQDTEAELTIVPWEQYRRSWVVGSHDASAPTEVSEDWNQDLFLGAKPDDVYRVTLPFWRSNQSLAADGDTPEMPADYHMLIVYWALTKYAYAVVAQEILARANVDGGALYDSLVSNQSFPMFNISLPPALA